MVGQRETNTVVRGALTAQVFKDLDAFAPAPGAAQHIRLQAPQPQGARVLRQPHLALR